MAVEDWNTNAALNVSLEGVNVAEGSLPADFNDCFRKIAAAIKVFFNKTYRKSETIRYTAAGAADPFLPSAHTEGDIWIEYTP